MHIDLSPLYRSAIGFDRLAQMLESNANSSSGYPPYNIEAISQDRYRITMAVAGFNESELEIISQENSLVVKGRKEPRDDSRNYLYRGIAERNFERSFQLADHVKVIEANMENGLLHIELEREIPEEMKPRKISIKTDSTLIEGEK